MMPCHTLSRHALTNVVASDCNHRLCTRDEPGYHRESHHCFLIHEAACPATFTCSSSCYLSVQSKKRRNTFKFTF